MLVKNQKIIMKWNSKNKKWYESKGYIYTKMKNEFEISVDDLPENSHVKVSFICDFCGIEFKRKWTYYNRNKKRSNTILEDCCDSKDCLDKKIQESNLINYGVEYTTVLESTKSKCRETTFDRYGTYHYSQTDKFKQDYKNTCQEKYGVDNVYQIDEIKERIKENNINKYGVKYYAQTEECKEKYKNTCMEKYGVPNTFLDKNVQNKIEKTMMERYGVKKALESDEILKNMQDNLKEKYGVSSVSQLEEVKIKKAETYYKNGTIATSTQQRYVWKLIGGELNYSDNTPSLDIAFLNEKIYIEVNGSGHNLPVKTGWMSQEEFNSKERRRYYWLKNNGWKAIFINTSCDYLPCDEVIINEINKAKEWFKIDDKGHSHYNINIGKVVDDKNYGKLRKIKKEDLNKFEEAI